MKQKSIKMDYKSEPVSAWIVVVVTLMSDECLLLDE